MFYKSEILKQKVYKTGQVSKIIGVSIQTVIRYCENGVIPYGRTAKNYRIIEANDLADYLEKQSLLIDDLQKERKDVIYARVSTYNQKKCGDLDCQIEKIKLFAIDHNVQNLCILSDIGSGLNDNRRKLQKLLSMVQNGEVNRIFVSYKDRLARFGFNYIKRICDFHDVQIIIVSEEVDHKSDSEELAEDIIALIHSFSGDLKGLRHAIKESIDD